MEPRPIDSAPTILVVTGIQAAGKSTVADRLARRFARGAHVEADLLHRMVVAGRADVGEPGEPDPSAAAQLRLRLRQMCLVGRAFVEAGYTAVLDDIIIGERWDHLQAELRGLPFSLIVLAPRAEVVIAERDARRAKPPLGAGWAHHLDGELRRTMAGIGLWVDNSAQTPEETADEILRRLALSPPPCGAAPLSCRRREEQSPTNSPPS